MTAAVLAATVAAGFFSRAPAFACTCLERSVAEDFESAAYVFIGTAMVVEERPEQLAATFSLHEILKGRLPRSVDVVTDGPDACGVPFVSGSRYVVFADDVETGALRTSACAGTTDNASVRAEARTLGRGTMLEPAASGAGEQLPAAASPASRAGPIAAAGMIVAGMLVALGVYARRRLFTTGDPR